ncbi:MAG TPA: serine/threonine-protein kinase, partial [Blastocatellia bacterium]
MTRDRLELVEELFEEALRMQADRRSQSLRRACGSDTDLLEEVESLLAAHAEAESFIETSAYNVFADVLTFAESESLEGKQVGHYYVLSMLGRGGMGEVYLAEDNLLARKVALKVLPPSPAAASIRLERFVREARAASALNHPNIVTIYEIGRFEDSHFIAQELVEGQTLRERITGKLIDVEPAIDIGIQVGRALSASHAAGVVHRDIKPENIMIRPDGVVKVLDFGLAKFTEVASAKMSGSGGVFGSDPANETVPGTVMGTVTYMSPEQARGSAIDQRSDMFSLGVVLYEMLCGRPPFKGETPSDTIAEILKSEPKPAGELRNGLPVGIEEILDRSLKKDVAARYQTIDEMLAALRSIDPKRVSSKSFLGRRYLVARRAA